jgi:hypothetical protein
MSRASLRHVVSSLMWSAPACGQLPRRGRCSDAWLDNKIAAFFVWLFQSLFHTRAPGRSAVGRGSKSPVFEGAFVRDSTRTGDPLLTMYRRTQPVATHGKGFGLFLRFLRPRDLPLIATCCNHGAP